VSEIEIKVPDIGDFKNVEIIEVHVKPGDTVKADDPLITLESDKAAMEVPAPGPGRIAELLVRLGDRVSQGTTIARLERSEASNAAVAMSNPHTPADEAARPSLENNAPAMSRPVAPEAGQSLPLPVDFGGAFAGPAVRRLARELDLDLKSIPGTGPKGRITKEDIKRAMADLMSSGGGIPEIPVQDFAKHGPIETVPLSRIKKISGPHLHRAWLNVPHVTHTDEADITELEQFRNERDAAATEKGYRVTLLAFILKAAVVPLKEYPEVNASLAPDKSHLILKRYYNIGVAVDTPDGLVVPVIKDVDRKGITELSQELGAVSKRMREGRIEPADIQGATFSISSLGGIGGTAFTPIVNAPEVAILGVVRAQMKPRWDGEGFAPRLMLPLCLSYDHRVIDGATAARFTRRLADILEDIRQIVL
jgi:pyruvate dehydrogenase E2 component (dihydrolipoamide acetyltransferase)